MLPFNLNIPQYSSQAVGTYTPSYTPMSINNIPEFDGYTFDERTGKYYKGDFLGKLFTEDQLNKMLGKPKADKFSALNLPKYTSPEHQYNALANMMTPNDVMTMMTSAGFNPAGAGRFANTAYGGGLLGK